MSSRHGQSPGSMARGRKILALSVPLEHRIPATRDIAKRRHPAEAGHALLEDFEPLLVELDVEVRDTGDIPAGPREARHESLPHGIRAAGHNWDRGRGLLSRDPLGRGPGGDHLNTGMHQVVGQVAKPLL